MTAERDTEVLIVGGGVAGLTLGIALRQYGIDFLLFEQAGDLRKVQAGSGLHIGYNATRAFKHLGLLDELTERGGPVARFEFMTASGKHLGTTPKLDGELALGVLRPVFHEFLVDTIDETRLRTDAEFVSFEQDDIGVTAHFADGSAATGDVLIGADGLRSTLRAQLLGEEEPRYAGYCTRRGVVETDLADDGLHRNFLGRGQRFKSHPVGGGQVYWTACTNEPPGGQEDGAEMKRTVLERFEGWPEPIRSFVVETDESKLFLADTYDRDPVVRWGEGRVTLLGDSAHPMTWDRGQGACQGIEGAVLLARQLSEGGDDPAAALRAWEAERIPRTRKVVLDSRRSGSSEQTEKRWVGALRNRAIKLVTKGSFYKKAHANMLVDYGPVPSRVPHGIAEESALE
jgi:2-polyprenyl-6-methoxyphenol hydroxylase-like FAD-dependent oxidoreductase